MKRILTLFTAFLLLAINASAQEDNKYDDTAEEIPPFVEERDPATFYNMKGTHEFHLGLGYPNLAAAALKIANRAGFENDGGATPNFTLKYEYGLTKDIGIGTHLGYYSAKTPAIPSSFEEFQTSEIAQILGGIGCGLGLPDNPIFNCDTIYTRDTMMREGAYDRVHATSIGLRFAYHKRVVDNIDLYASTVIGYSFLKKKRIGDQEAEFENFAGKLPTFIYFAGAGARYYITPNWAIYGELGYGALTVFNVGATYRIIKPY